MSPTLTHAVSAVTVTYDLVHQGAVTVTRNADAITPHGTFCIVNNGPLDSLPLDLGSLTSRDASDRIAVVPYQSNRGFGSGCNDGVAASPVNPLILFVNPDAEITATMVMQLVNAFAMNPKLGIASPQLRSHRGIPVETGGTFPTILGLAFEKVVRSFYLQAKQVPADTPARNPQYQAPDWVSGAVMMIRREAWDSVSGFDPNFYLYYEDIDLCRRIRAAGWEVGVVPTATAIHESGGSQWRPGTRSRVERIYFQSQAYYFRKHYGRVAEFILRAVRLPYVATGLRRWYLRRFGVQVHVDHSAT